VKTDNFIQLLLSFGRFKLSKNLENLKKFDKK
jgi:hypothetical protein